MPDLKTVTVFTRSNKCISIRGTGKIKRGKQRSEHFASRPSKTETKHWKRKLCTEKRIVLQHTNKLVAQGIRGNNPKTSFL